MTSLAADIQRYVAAAREVAERAAHPPVRAYPTGTLPRLLLTVHGEEAFSLGTATKLLIHALPMLSDDVAREKAAEALFGLAQIMDRSFQSPPTHAEAGPAFWLE